MQWEIAAGSFSLSCGLLFTLSDSNLPLPSPILCPAFYIKCVPWLHSMTLALLKHWKWLFIDAITSFQNSLSTIINPLFLFRHSGPSCLSWYTTGSWLTLSQNSLKKKRDIFHMRVVCEAQDLVSFNHSIASIVWVTKALLCSALIHIYYSFFPLDNHIFWISVVCQGLC